MARILTEKEKLEAVDVRRAVGMGAEETVYTVTEGEGAGLDTGKILECVGQIAIRDPHGKPLPSVPLFRIQEQAQGGATPGEQGLFDDIGRIFAGKMIQYTKEAGRKA